jgi:hypothetical protein
MIKGKDFRHLILCELSKLLITNASQADLPRLAIPTFRAMKSNDGRFLFRTRSKRSGRGWLLIRSKESLIGRFGTLPWPTLIDAAMKKQYLPSGTATSHASLLSGCCFLDWNLV